MSSKNGVTKLNKCRINCSFRATIVIHEARLLINFSVITVSIFFCAEMDREWMHLSRTDKRDMHGVSQFITNAKAYAGNGNHVFCPCKDFMNQRKWTQIESVRMHLITKGSCQTIRYGLYIARLV